jgi:pimeloyl-ACP methyl ester carboxylesterase
MATFLLVPGAWLGGWCWQGVTPALREAGHTVYTPTLTGLGERVHLGTPGTDLEVHITDIVNVLAWEEPRDVILVGHSYGGLVITGVADRAPDRIAGLVYLDALVPGDGQALRDFQGPEERAAQEEGMRHHGDGWRIPVPDDLGPEGAGMTADDLRRFREKGTGQPAATFAQPIRLTNPDGPTCPRAYIWCSASIFPPGEPVTVPDYLKPYDNTPGWRMHQIPTGHWPMFSAPRETAETLLRVAAGERPTA